MRPTEKAQNLPIQQEDIEYSAIRAQGSGGQNVNKVSSAIHLKYDVAKANLPDFIKHKILRSSDNRISKSGVIVIKAQRFRTQEQNRQDALQRLLDLVADAIKTPKVRRATKPTKASKMKRLDSKKKKSQQKAMRKKVHL